MSNKRKLYEKRAEILTKRLLSRLYSLEARAMETQLDVQKGIDKINDKIDWDSRIQKIKEERENLNSKYQEMINASGEKWEQISGAFENYFNQINENRRDVSERANDWIEEANVWVNDMEERARNYSQETWNKFGDQVNSLKTQRDKLNEKLNQLRSEGSERFENVRSGMESDIKNLRSAITNLIQHYQKGDIETSEEEKQK